MLTQNTQQKLILFGDDIPFAVVHLISVLAHRFLRTVSYLRLRVFKSRNLMS